MGRKKGERHYYALLLAASLFWAAVVWAAGLLPAGEPGRIADHRLTAGTVRAAADFGEAQTPLQETASAVETDGAAAQEAAEETAETDTGAEEPIMYEAAASYFDDALFIGDSRTVGLLEYGDLGSAEVVADSGMSVYKIFNRKFGTVSGEKKLLETVLSERQFGKIYLMMGINELGYDYENTVSKYNKVLEKLRELQPDAIIFLGANLHITEEKSESSPVYTNENIDRFNRALAQMADGQTLFYLDVNELFDDENGTLAEIYTSDGVHVRGKYYPEWVAWLLRHARKTSGENTNM